MAGGTLCQCDRVSCISVPAWLSQLVPVLLLRWNYVIAHVFIVLCVYVTLPQKAKIPANLLGTCSKQRHTDVDCAGGGCDAEVPEGESG